MKSSTARRRPAADWESVRRYHGWIKVSSASAGFLSSKFLDFCNSLVLVHAYSVLQAALEQYEREGKFAAGGRELKRLMKASQRSLHWVDFVTVDRGRDKRNDVAHKGLFPPRSESWVYMKAIEAELVSWHIIPTQPAWP
jgi:hypothetical protein